MKGLCLSIEILRVHITVIRKPLLKGRTDVGDKLILFLRIISLHKAADHVIHRLEKLSLLHNAERHVHNFLPLLLHSVVQGLVFRKHDLEFHVAQGAAMLIYLLSLGIQYAVCCLPLVALASCIICKSEKDKGKDSDCHYYKADHRILGCNTLYLQHHECKKEGSRRRRYHGNTFFHIIFIRNHTRPLGGLSTSYRRHYKCRHRHRYR